MAFESGGIVSFLHLLVTLNDNLLSVVFTTAGTSGPNGEVPVFCNNY